MEGFSFQLGSNNNGDPCDVIEVTFSGLHSAPHHMLTAECFCQNPTVNQDYFCFVV